MSEEAIHIMRRLWRENDAAYDGAFTRFEHVTIAPKPAQPGGVPIWLASNDVEAGLRRVGRVGDAWMNNIKDPETYRICWEKIRAYAAQAGRAIPAQFNQAPTSRSPRATRRPSSRERSFSPSTTTAPTKPSSKRHFVSRDAGTKSSIASRNSSMSARALLVLRFAARDQLEQLERCADALDRRGLLR